MDSDRIEHAIHSILMDCVRCARAPGLQYVAVTASDVLHNVALGSATLHDRLMTPETTLMAYSMSKTVTALAVLSLIERHGVSVDESLGKYVPEHPYGDAVTVRHLLSHTGGLPNPIPIRWVHPADADASFDEPAALRIVLSRHGKLHSAPGTRFRYSNIGYWLLGVLVERLSGVAFTRYVEDHIAAPLRLGRGDFSYRIPDRELHASGYLERFGLMNFLRPLLVDRRLNGRATGAWHEILPHYVNGPAFGGLIARGAGIGTFLQGQLRPASALPGAAGRRLLFEQQSASGTAIPMTLGWHIGYCDARRFYFKEGGGAGFHCMMRLDPVNGFGSVLMTNATSFNVRAALDSLDRIVLAG